MTIGTLVKGLFLASAVTLGACDTTYTSAGNYSCSKSSVHIFANINGDKYAKQFVNEYGRLC